MFKACLFDLDGVIVDTAKYHYIAWRELANKLGFDFTPEQNELLKGVSRNASLEILLNIGEVTYLSPAAKLSLADEKNTRYLEYVLEMPQDEILPGAKQLLQELRANDIKIALGSASKNALKILQRLDLLTDFDAIVDGNVAPKAKPDPQVFLIGAELLGVNPSECIVFEDAAAGIEAARAAQIRTIGVGSRANLPDADFIVKDLSECSYADLQRWFK